MEREKILVRDSKGIFLKMFKRKFKDDFEFSESPFLIEDDKDDKVFDHSIFVVYDKFEMISYLKLEKKESKVLVCLFNKQLYSSLTCVQEINNLILLDGSKTKQEISKNLKDHFKRENERIEQVTKPIITGSAIFETEFHNLYKTLFFLL